MKPSLAHKILSYFYPVRIRKSETDINPFLELCLYKGQWQLATKDAIYSDGDRYRPLKLALSKIKHDLSAVKNVLVLGTGLGSAVDILHKMSFYPQIDLVEIDRIILEWAAEVLPKDTLSEINFICEDAGKFVAETSNKYDLIIVDIFINRLVPHFVAEEAFLAACKKALHVGGKILFNFIIADKENWEKFCASVTRIFPNLKIYELSVNRVLIATT